MSLGQILTVGLAGAVYLDLWSHDSDNLSASIVVGSSDKPDRTLMFCSCKRGDARVTDDVDGIWFGASLVKLPLADLLRVADALLLEIPQPVLPAAVEADPSLRSATVAGISA